MSASETRHVKLLYFAWVREKVGRSAEDVDLPAGTKTVADLVAWLKSRGPEFEAAFERANVVRTAVDKVHVKSNVSILNAREIAFFPPVTGG
jgi:molybdopterin synthase sulfur carrier subunit